MADIVHGALRDAHEWGRPIPLASVDLDKAFDQIELYTAEMATCVVARSSCIRHWGRAHGARGAMGVANHRGGGGGCFRDVGQGCPTGRASLHPTLWNVIVSAITRPRVDIWWSVRLLE